MSQLPAEDIYFWETVWILDLFPNGLFGWDVTIFKELFVTQVYCIPLFSPSSVVFFIEVDRSGSGYCLKEQICLFFKKWGNLPQIPIFPITIWVPI
jgi:hypothetical protein